MRTKNFSSSAPPTWRVAETAAGRTIQERAVLILSARETEMFVDAILSPSEPGPILRAAARHYKQMMGA
jgi:uncharacterized protein (DUF1778 family)